jgi:hypothetical protein
MSRVRIPSPAPLPPHRTYGDTILDEDGTANVRVTCGNGIYIGVLGRDADISMALRVDHPIPADTEPDARTRLHSARDLRQLRPLLPIGAAMTASRERAWDDIHDLLPSGGKSAQRRSIPVGTAGR